MHKLMRRAPSPHVVVGAQLQLLLVVLNHSDNARLQFL
jgi:hypothetical protein